MCDPLARHCLLEEWKELSQLVEEGKLERVGTGRWTHYLPTAGLWGEH